MKSAHSGSTTLMNWPFGLPNNITLQQHKCERVGITAHDRLLMAKMMQGTYTHTRCLFDSTHNTGRSVLCMCVGLHVSVCYDDMYYARANRRACIEKGSRHVLRRLRPAGVMLMWHAPASHSRCCVYAALAMQYTYSCSERKCRTGNDLARKTVRQHTHRGKCPYIWNIYMGLDCFGIIVYVGGQTGWRLVCNIQPVVIVRNAVAARHAKCQA